MERQSLTLVDRSRLLILLVARFLTVVAQLLVIVDRTELFELTRISRDRCCLRRCCLRLGTCAGVFHHLGGSQIQTLPYRFLHGFAFSSRLHHQYPVISPNCDYQLAVFAVISKQSGCYCRRYFANFKPAARCFRRNLAEVWLPWLQLFRRIWPSTRRFRLSFAGIWVLLSPSFRCISPQSRGNLTNQHLAVFAAVSLGFGCHFRR